MNYLQKLKSAIAGNYKAMVAVLKEVRSAGIKVKVRLNACKRVIEDEIRRLIKSMAIASKASRFDTIGKLYVAIALPMDAAKSITRAVKGAIALATKLGVI